MTRQHPCCGKKKKKNKDQKVSDATNMWGSQVKLDYLPASCDLWLPKKKKCPRKSRWNRRENVIVVPRFPRLSRVLSKIS